MTPDGQARWTVLEALRWTETFFRRKALSTPRLDAELLLAHALGTSRVGVYLAHDRPLVDAERARLRGLVSDRGRGVPVAYLTGEKEFYGVGLAVDRRVLVPRPETEGVVDRALELMQPADGGPWRVADVGTGSGAIACALAAERPGVWVVATELDAGAALVAAGNAAMAGGRVRVLRADLLAPVGDGALDLVVGNPPYVAEGDRGALHPHVAAHEPALALFGGPDGLATYRRLLPQASRAVRPGGHVVLELGQGQAEAVTEIARAAGLTPLDVRPDLAGIPRVLCARR